VCSSDLFDLRREIEKKIREHLGMALTLAPAPDPVSDKDLAKKKS